MEKWNKVCLKWEITDPKAGVVPICISDELALQSAHGVRVGLHGPFFIFRSLKITSTRGPLMEIEVVFNDHMAYPIILGSGIDCSELEHRLNQALENIRVTPQKNGPGQIKTCRLLGSGEEFCDGAFKSARAIFQAFNLCGGDDYHRLLNLFELTTWTYVKTKGEWVLFESYLGRRHGLNRKWEILE